MKINKNFVELFFLIIVLFIVTLYYLQIKDRPSPLQTISITYLYFGFLFLFATRFFLILHSFIKKDKKDYFAFDNNKKFLAIIFIIYIICIYFIGFYFASFLFLLVFLIKLRVGKFQVIATSIISIIIMYLVFQEILKIRLP